MPARSPKNADTAAATIHGRSRLSARKGTANAIGATRIAIQSVQPGSGVGRTCGAGPNRRSATRAPTAAPKPMARNVSAAPARRAVPATRLRVASSMKPRVTAKPGTRMMRPPRVVTYGESGGKRAAASTAANPASAAAVASYTPVPAWARQRKSGGRPIRKPMTVVATTSRIPPPKNRQADPEASAAAIVVAIGP